VTATTYGPEFFVGRSETVTRSAAVVVPVIVDLLYPRSVLDAGCGQGEWLEAFGDVEAVGVDIAAPERSGFFRCDLTKPLDLGRDFDLVLSLEVGEHLPEEAADTYVATLVGHSGSVVFSSAVPGQLGKGHINCQPREYWHEKFNLQGYAALDAIRPLIQDSRVSSWYRDNIFLYQRRDR